MKITTQDAKIKTATVDVKVLTLSGKQVTLSVFRQLEREGLIDLDTALFRGVPWGRVNYFWGNCVADHYHVVWQKGSELRRACVWPRRYEHVTTISGEVRRWPLSRYELDEALIDYVSLLVREKRLFVTGGRRDKWTYEWSGYRVTIHRKRYGRQYVDVGDALIGLWSSVGSHGKQALAVIEDHARKLGATSAEWERDVLIPIRDEIKRMETEYDRRISEIKSLDQLFIAV